ncbi:MAG: ABC transporter ATP-binding protein [Alphaproteobacteria bacterium]|nr:ABC transporter ATP-binding protein [Alphaproteobacteria bacterium]
MIEVRQVTLRFGGIVAVDDCSLRAEAGRITGLIGPNGAGKTSLFNVIAGRYRATSGQVLLDGEDITGMKPHRLFSKGLLRTFQIAHEFARLTVRENLMLVPARQHGEAVWGRWLAPARVAEEERRLADRADEVLAFLRLEHVAGELAGNLSGGQKKLLELGRTMMAEAKIVLLDEIGAGVNRTLLATLVDDIARLNRERGMTFFLIEHDMDLIARLCDRVIVMAEGKVLTEGTPAEIRRDARVLEAYLGGGFASAAT